MSRIISPERQMRVEKNLSEIVKLHAQLPKKIKGVERAWHLLRSLKSAKLSPNELRAGKTKIAELTGLTYSEIMRLASLNPYREKSILRLRRSNEEPTELTIAELGNNTAKLNKPDLWDKDNLEETNVRRALLQHAKNGIAPEKLTEVTRQTGATTTFASLIKKRMQLEGILK